MPKSKHEMEVVFTDDNHGYPYQAQCKSCGYKGGRYVHRVGASLDGELHLRYPDMTREQAINQDIKDSM